MVDTLARMRQMVGATADWTAHDLVLGDGEVALERYGTGQVRARIGNGVTPFSSCPVLGGSLDLAAADARYVQEAETFVIGGAPAANKWPRLDASGKIDASLVTIPLVLKYRGTINATGMPPGGAVAGDLWINDTPGTVNGTWGPPAAGQTINPGDWLILNTSGQWQVVPMTAGIVSEAPANGKTYGRQDGAWISAFTIDGLTVNNNASIGATLQTGTGVAGAACAIEVGGGRTAVGESFVDFHAVPSVDYDARILRLAGVDGDLHILNAGAGRMALVAPGGLINLWTAGNQGLEIKNDGSCYASRNLVVAGDHYVSGTAFLGPAISMRDDPANDKEMYLSWANNANSIVYGGIGINNAGHMRIWSTTGSIVLQSDVITESSLSVSTNLGVSGTIWCATTISAVSNISSSANIFATGSISVYPATAGGIELLPGTVGRSGHVRIIKNDRTSIGYIGNQPEAAGGNIEYNNTNAGGHAFIGRVYIPDAAVGGSGRLHVRADPTQTNYALALVNSDPAGMQAVGFTVNGVQVGQIGCNTTTTSYATTSDERLKENIADAADAGAVIDALAVRQFDWKANGEHVAFGMIAQELDSQYPGAVWKPIPGEDGTVPEELDTWGVDYSKLVPLLIKEIQSLRARVATLEAG
jgi:hypothetical protein